MDLWRAFGMAKTAEQLAKQAEHELNNYDGPTPVLGDVLLALANACFEEAAQVASMLDATQIVERIRALKSPAPGTAKQGGGK